MSRQAVSENMLHSPFVNPEAERRDRVKKQVLQRIPEGGVVVALVELFNDLTCNISYREFREVLDELAAARLIELRKSSDSKLRPDTRELFDTVSRP